MSVAWALIQPHWAVEGKSAPRFKNMKYAQRRSASRPAGLLVAAMALVAGLSGCAAGRWFESGPKGNNADPAATAANDFNTQAATYVRDLCALPREERDRRARALNEALLPNHANISCGRGGNPDE
jgi:hypothetical protein